jgi:hypothetical protein
LEEIMTTTDSAAAYPRRRLSAGIKGELFSRLRGPGGYYNIGNLIGLFTGLGLQLAMADTAGLSGLDAVAAYFVGTPATVAMTVATIVFLVAGEVYHQAWRGGERPDTTLNRIADVLSALGAIILAISLIAIGQPLLAMVGGLLIALGKLGSAVVGDSGANASFWPDYLPDFFRSTVLMGRMPGMAAAGLQLWHQLQSGGSGQSLIQPAALLICHFLWFRADMLLFQVPEKTSATQRA